MLSKNVWLITIIPSHGYFIIVYCVCVFKNPAFLATIKMTSRLFKCIPVLLLAVSIIFPNNICYRNYVLCKIDYNFCPNTCLVEPFFVSLKVILLVMELFQVKYFYVYKI